MPSTQLPLTPVAQSCQDHLRTAIRHMADVALHFAPARTLHCVTLPAVKAAQAAADAAALAGDTEATLAACRHWYRVWVQALETAEVPTERGT